MIILFKNNEKRKRLYDVIKLVHYLSSVICYLNILCKFEIRKCYFEYIM